MSFPYYTSADTLDGTFDSALLHQQILNDSLIVTPFSGVFTNGNHFHLVFESTPSVPEQTQCNAVVAAHSSLPAVQDNLISQIKSKRDDDRLEYVISAEYPPSSGNFFSCSTASQDNWSKLGTLDTRGLVSYPFVVTTNDERGSYSIPDSADLTNVIGSVSAAVLTERTLAQTYIDAVIAAPDQASAQVAAQPYLDL